MSNRTNKKGGNKIENILIVSHGNRMRCLLSELYKREFKKKFKNTAILLMKIRSDSENTTLETSLFYDGELSSDTAYATDSKKNNKYLTNNTNDKNYFGNLETKLNNKIYNGNYDIYIVRHGEGIHNLAGKFAKALNQSKYFDPKLTDEGVRQANRSGKNLTEIRFDNVFISDLYRTKHTLESLNLELNIKPVVLPCAQELNKYTYTTSHCDNSLINLINGAENVSKCKSYVNKECKSNDEKCNEIKNKCLDIADWSYYEKNKKLNCVKNNMIVQAINYKK